MKGGHKPSICQRTQYLQSARKQGMPDIKKKKFRQVVKQGWIIDRYIEKLSKRENKAIINSKENKKNYTGRGKVITGCSVAQLWIAFAWSW